MIMDDLAAAVIQAALDRGDSEDDAATRIQARIRGGQERANTEAQWVREDLAATFSACFIIKIRDRDNLLLAPTVFDHVFRCES